MTECKYYEEWTGICCCGECPECADVCVYEDYPQMCEFFESEETYL